MTEQLKSVAELVSVQNSRLRLKPLVCVLIGLFCSPALAQVTSRGQTPTGGVVTAGQANISQSGSVTTINQTTNRAAIKWNSFKDGTFNQLCYTSLQFVATVLLMPLLDNGFSFHWKFTLRIARQESSTSRWNSRDEWRRSGELVVVAWS